MHTHSTRDRLEAIEGAIRVSIGRGMEQYNTTVSWQNWIVELEMCILFPMFSLWL